MNFYSRLPLIAVTSFFVNTLLFFDVLAEEMKPERGAADRKNAYLSGGGIEVEPSKQRQRSDVMVRIRTIQATELITMDEPGVPGHEFHEMSVDSRIHDLKHKLRKLHYRHYRLTGTYERIVPVKKRETIALAGGHTLTLRPLYLQDRRVGMWLKWSDSSGSDILDTRMHFNPDECMVTGTDSKAQTGFILAISASAVED